MKTFNLFTYHCSEEEKKVWEDTGFKASGEKGIVDHRQYMDVVFGYWLARDKEVWALIKTMMPKIFVVGGYRELVFPKDLSGVYDQRLIIGKKLLFNLGSKIQGKVKVPDWETYKVNGLLTEAGEVKAVSVAVYRFLLEDVIRENEEWCGHMSSVLGPM